MCTARVVPLLAALTLATSLLAQSAPGGRVAGIVTIGDVPLPGAIVSIAVGKDVRTLVTESDGRFAADHIPLGAIVEVRAEVAGMKSQKRRFALTSGAASRDFTFAMKFAGEVTTSNPVRPSTEDPHRFTVTQRDHEKLPIGRSPRALLDLLPGTH
ncbi:MAG: hypothetical protein JWO56_2338 [Acidobacteria bacterium]|nr:hypothetical protein [Acidobacteriota bacterium]